MRRLLILSLLATSCISAPPASITWARDMVVGYDFTPVDPKHVERWSFESSGSVVASLATSDGGMMGPIWDWKIQSGRLQIMDGNQLWDEWTLLRRDSHTITVRRRGGDVMQYKYARHQKA